MQYGKDNIHSGHKMPNENYHMGDNKQYFKHLCKEKAGANCEVEMTDGSVFQGQIHGHDDDHMYLVMRTQNGNGQTDRFFPGFGPGFPFFVAPFFPGFGIFGFPFFGIRRFRRFWW